MRKLILEIEPNENWAKLLSPIFENFHRFELLEMMRIDYEEGVKIGLMECHTKRNIPIHEAKIPDNVEILSVLKSENRKHTCVVKIQVPKEFTQMLTEFKLNLIWTTPSSVAEDKRIYSCIGDQENLMKFVEKIKKYGKVVNMHFQKAVYQPHDILSVLTDKQREVLIAAKKNGYYDLPKKISSEDLSNKVGISKATLLEHLRKAEERLLANILAGY
ncbi:MAG: helix-turn-helix domain-containing protein [Thermoplasmata archaeon]|nr:MAG: helix-turn-helix domain-containing protein [Thermoplasmata archaeon]